MEFKDYYNILGIDPESDITEIKNAFRKMAGESHPDKHPHSAFDTAPFIEIKEAYDILSDPVRREEYDRVYRRHKRGIKSESPVFERSFSNHLFQDDSERFFSEIFHHFFKKFPGRDSGRDSDRSRDTDSDHIHYDDML